VDHWIDSPESRCVAGRAHWAEIACETRDHDEGRELQLPDHRSVERSSLFRRNGRIYVQDDPYIAQFVCCGA
jgi:hypothetical protein